MPTDDPASSPARKSLFVDMKTSEDWWAIWCGALLLAISSVTVWINRPDDLPQQVAAAEIDDKAEVKISNPLKSYLSKPGKWIDDPRDAFFKNGKAKVGEINPPRESLVFPIICVFAVIAILFAVATSLRGQSGTAFLKAFPFVFLLATLAYVLAGQKVISDYNLEYALWALVVGLAISNSVGTPAWLMPAALTEFYIKTGLVLLGAEVLMSRLLALGIPGIFVAWVVTPIVLVSTYIFGQKVLKISSASLNMVISADMSVCGVSAAIATAAACRAKKEELSLAIGLSLTFTVIMMVALPAFIRVVGMDEILGGAWLGGTIDSTGAVAAAGAALGDRALEVAATVKMIQNILIGVVAFCVSVFWVTRMEKNDDGSTIGILEVWYRFPKFVLGFIVASIIFSVLHASMLAGPEFVDAVIGGGTKTLRGWFFCLAFVSIGLSTNVRELMPYLRGGKPLILYLCGQTLNLLLTLFMAWLMFRVVFRDFIDSALQ